MRLILARRGVGVADRAGFENQCALTGTAGSNPALSVGFQPDTVDCKWSLVASTMQTIFGVRFGSWDHLCGCNPLSHFLGKLQADVVGCAVHTKVRPDPAPLSPYIRFVRQLASQETPMTPYLFLPSFWLAASLGGPHHSLARPDTWRNLPHRRTSPVADGHAT